jgi:PhnB protein
MTKRSHVPEGWPTVAPRIFVAEPEGLIAFVKRVFGAGGDYQPDRPARERMPACVYVYVPDADATYSRALDSGATSLEDPRDTAYGDRRAMVRDAWGNTWQIATHRGGFRT